LQQYHECVISEKLIFRWKSGNIGKRIYRNIRDLDQLRSFHLLYEYVSTNFEFELYNVMRERTREREKLD